MKFKYKGALSIIIALFLLVAMFAPVTYRIVAEDDDDDNDAYTWYITPTGVDDTANIQTAFDSAAPGDTIQLATGQFYCRNINATNFHGTFKGEGQTYTTIDVIPGGPVIYDYYIPLGLQWNYFFRFVDGDFTVSDLEFDITDPNPSDPWYWDGEPETGIGDLVFLESSSGNTINARFKRVGFKGHAGSYAGRNVACVLDLWSVDVLSTVSGSLTVSRCSFENINCPISVERVADSNVLISDNTIVSGYMGCLLAFGTNNQITITRNQFTNIEDATIYMREIDDVVISFNEMDNTELGYRSFSPIFGLTAKNAKVIGNYITGSYIYGIEPFVESNGWTIAFNTFGKTITQETLGIDAYLGVIRIRYSHDCTVAFNKFYDVHDSTFAIYVLGNNNDILHNRIQGSGLIGIRVDMDSTECYLRGNNLKHFDATYADIYLHYDTSYNIVYLHGADSIIDQGTDNIIYD